MTEVTVRTVRVALRLLDDLTGLPVSGATVGAGEAAAVPKSDGFYALVDLPDGSHQLRAEAPRYRPFTQPVSLPLAIAGEVVLDVPGENELMLVAQAVDRPARTVDFAARDLFAALPAGTRVVTSRLVTQLTAELEGEGVNQVQLADVGSGPGRIRPGDVLRLVGERAVRLRPGPYYPFAGAVRRLLGSVLEAGTGAPVAGATVRVTRVNGGALTAVSVGTTPANTAELLLTGAGPARRVVGTARDLSSPCDERGRYGLYFSRRADLSVDQVDLEATAPGFLSAAAAAVDLTARPETIVGFSLTRS